MALNFGFYADPALTTRLTGPVIMAVSGATSATASIYFGSPNFTDECFAADGGQIVISCDSATVSIQGSGQSVSIGSSMLGGVTNALRLDLSSSGPAGDVAISTNQLVEWVANG